MPLKAKWAFHIEFSSPDEEDAWAARMAGGDLEGAEILARKELEDALGAEGHPAPESLPLFDSLGATLLLAGKGEEAGRVFREALVASARALGGGDPATLVRASNAACCRLAWEGFDGAVDFFAAIRAMKRDSLGTDHHSTIAACSNEAVALAETGRLEESAALFGKVGEAFELLRGPGHEYSAMARYNLGLVRALMEAERPGAGGAIRRGGGGPPTGSG
ncbi:MAG: hypothetical protein LBQ79_12300 [Deltaproteobacteria bacterium]|jgi:hypothetical protein|nr:hypothetical protein [Deltaproteobacteria bacterium]